MDLSKPAPESQPLSFKGWQATALLFADRVEFKRIWLSRLGGNRSGTVMLADALKIHSVPPTRLVNGYVHLMTAEDPGALRNLTMATQQQPAGNPRTILFSWNQRDTYTKFLAAVEAAWREQGPQL
ncbi:hypothetical protein [Streptomyces coeruleorubidus]|uniref:hypothetical protein n=1 Tax=Streptomyces coeruleorubidus TaxID=116188 RepID=UPI0033A19506